MFVLGDSDMPGQDGAAALARAVTKVAKEVRLLKLPYPIEVSHGKDVRDFFLDGHTFCDLKRLADTAEVVTPEPDETHYPQIRNYKVERTSSDGHEKPPEVPLNLDEVLGNLRRVKGDWPRLAGNQLFVDYGEEGIRWIDKPSQFLSWMTEGLPEPPDFKRSCGFISETTLFESCHQFATKYKSIEYTPHEPPMAERYYVEFARTIAPGHGQHLKWLLNRFCPATAIDRELLLAFFATTIWGGEGGSRPCFVATSPDRGCGKTTLFEIAGEFAGGLIDVSGGEDIDKLKARLLSSDGRRKRIALLDNLKSRKFSWAELESLITCPAISGRQNYVGEGERPNTLLWCITVNGIALSRDMAQRCVIIQLKKPEYSGTWKGETLAYVREHRMALLGDLIGFLRTDRRELTRFSRWASWDREVVSRLREAGSVQAMILERQKAVDVDDEEGELIEEYFRNRLSELTYDVDRQCIFIPSRISAEWLSAATSEKLSPVKATRLIGQHIESGLISRIVKSTRNDIGRGVFWAPGDAVSHPEIDIEERIKLRQTQDKQFWASSR